MGDERPKNRASDRTGYKVREYARWSWLPGAVLSILGIIIIVASPLRTLIIADMINDMAGHAARVEYMEKRIASLELGGNHINMKLDEIAGLQQNVLGRLELAEKQSDRFEDRVTTALLEVQKEIGRLKGIPNNNFGGGTR